MYKVELGETFTLVLFVVQDLNGIGGNGKTKDGPREALGHVTDSALRDTLSKGSVENTQLLHEVVKESALKQLGGDEASK